ncbi:hypothetical protein IKA15_02180 [bacterium]|nr:hypothetical protein [bacterium]
MDNKNYVNLFVLICFGLLLRVLGNYAGNGISGSLDFAGGISANSFFGARSSFVFPWLADNLHFNLGNFFGADIFGLIFGILSIIILYFIGYISSKENSNMGLFAGTICAVSGMLIAFGHSLNFVNLVFFISSLIVFLSLKGLKNKKLGNLTAIAVLSCLLVLLHPVSIFFVIFNFIAIFAFSNQKVKIDKAFTNFLFPLMLAIPICLFMIFGFLDVKANPFSININDVLVSYSALFSINPVGLKIAGVNQNILNSIVFWIFVFTPSIISAYFIFRTFVHQKHNIYWALSTSFATFFTVYLILNVLKINFAACHIIEIYPLFIFLFAKGIMLHKEKATRGVLFGLFVLLNVLGCLFLGLPVLK